MGKNARDQIPPPVVTPPSQQDQYLASAAAQVTQARLNGDQGLIGAASAQALQGQGGIRPRRDTVALPPPGEWDEAKARAFNGPIPAPAITELAARAISSSFGMAREYAAGAAELCRSADTPQARKNVARLLRLALCHLESP